jgi:hypothetical protein
MLASRADTRNVTEVNQILPTVLRSLSRPAARGFFRSVLSSLTWVEVYSPGGIYLGTAPGYVVELQRLSRVVERTTRGLFYHEFGYRLPPEHDVSAWAESGLGGVDSQVLKQLRGYCSTVVSQPGKVIGQGVFTYWYKRAEGEPNTTMWVMSFYQRVNFICMTAPRAAVEAVGKGLDLTLHLPETLGDRQAVTASSTSSS